MASEDPSDGSASRSPVSLEDREKIRDHVLLGLMSVLGLWNSSTVKVCRWVIGNDHSHVVLLDSDCGTVVVPFHQQIDECPYFGEVKEVQRNETGGIVRAGRHSNIASGSPSLAWDKDVLYLRPMTEWELSQTLSIVSGLLDGAPIVKHRPPEDDPYLLGDAHHGPGRAWSTYRAVYHRDGGCCQMCGATNTLHIDHKIPRSKGGSDAMENLWVLCRRCNLSKSDAI